MRKILQINSIVNSGSTGRIAEEIGQTAMTAGWESYIAYSRHARKSQSKLIKIGSVELLTLLGQKVKHKKLTFV